MLTCRVGHRASRTLDDAEGLLDPASRHEVPRHRGDPGEGRGSLAEQPAQLFEEGGLAFDLDQHAVRIVENETTKAESHGLSEDKGPIADSLHRSGDPDPPAL